MQRNSRHRIQTEIPIAPGQKEEQTADPRDLNLMPVLAENPVIYQGKPIAATSM